MASSIREIVAKDLDGQIGLDAGNGFIDPHGHRLREVVNDARYPVERLRHSRDQFLLAVEAGPCVDGAKQQVGIALVDAHRFSGEIGSADLDDYVRNFGELAQTLLDALADRDGFGERDAG